MERSSTDDSTGFSRLNARSAGPDAPRVNGACLYVVVSLQNHGIKDGNIQSLFLEVEKNQKSIYNCAIRE